MEALHGEGDVLGPRWLLQGGEYTAVGTVSALKFAKRLAGKKSNEQQVPEGPPHTQTHFVRTLSGGVARTRNLVVGSDRAVGLTGMTRGSRTGWRELSTTHR